MPAATPTTTRPPVSGPTALSFEGVSHRYGSGAPALDGVTLDVRRGEVLCLLGPSGCGKTTALRIAAGLERPSAGRVTIGGVEVSSPGSVVPPERRGVGLVFQDYALFPHLTILENVAFGLSSMSGAERARRARVALERVGMAGREGDYPHMLSGGQQQRVALARALAPEPRVLLLDEPYSGLDTRLKEQVRDQLLDVLKRSGCATVLVTHDAEEAMFMADRIAVMREGRVLQCGTPADLYCRPASPFVAGFLGDVNRVEGRVRKGRVCTALGHFPADGMEDGADATVLVRPEAIRIGGGDGEVTNGRVLRSRLLGRSSLVQFEAESEGLHAAVRARVLGVFLPEPGEDVRVSLDPEMAFVYPAGD